MRFSRLQRYILTTCWQQGSVRKFELEAFYRRSKNKPRPDSIPRILTESIERLTRRGLIAATGTQTQEKWTIHSIRLTRLGRRIARQLLGVQTRIRLR